MKTGRNSRRREGCADAFPIDAVLRDPVEGVAQEGPLHPPGLTELGCAVHLFSDIGELEVGGKGTRQEEGGACRDVRKLLGEPASAHAFTLRPLELRHSADLFDEAQELMTLYTDKLLAEEGNDEADVPAQCRVALFCRNGVIGRDGVTHVVANVGQPARFLRHERIVTTETSRFSPTPLPELDYLAVVVPPLSRRRDPGHRRRPRPWPR